MKVVCLLVNIKLDFQYNNSSLTSPKAGESLFLIRTGRTPQNAESLLQTRFGRSRRTFVVMYAAIPDIQAFAWLARNRTFASSSRLAADRTQFRLE